MCGFKVGDRVGIPWLHSTCGMCEFCLTGWETLCPCQSTTGFSVPGCLAQYCVADAKHIVRIPAALTSEAAAREWILFFSCFVCCLSHEKNFFLQPFSVLA